MIRRKGGKGEGMMFSDSDDMVEVDGSSEPKVLEGMGYGQVQLCEGLHGVCSTPLR